jgi:hypothetical protein
MFVYLLSRKKSGRVHHAHSRRRNNPPVESHTASDDEWAVTQASINLQSQFRLSPVTEEFGEGVPARVLSDDDGALEGSSLQEVDDRATGDRRAQPREGSDRRRKARPVFSEEMKASARLRSRGGCECANQSCWHFHKCKARGVAYMARVTSVGVNSCALFCRDCARTAGGREQVL